jgi:hypothetical protein
MLGTSRTEPVFPRHHDDMLVVRVRPSVAQPARRLAAGAQPDRSAPGLQALHQHEMNDELEYALPLGRAARRQVARNRKSGRVAAALTAAAREHSWDHPHTGHVLIRLRDPEHRAALHRRLAADPHIAAVSRVAARYLLLADSAADGMLPPERMWNHARIQLAAARRLRRFRSPGRIKVAVLDSGVDLQHPALRGRVAAYLHGFEARHPVRVSGRDIVGHGTHISGILNAARDETLGVQGIGPCRLTVMKVFSDRLEVDQAAQARVFLVDPVLYRWSLEECLARQFDVVNLSLGGPAPPDPHEAAIMQALLARGTTLVAAMGNALTGRSQPCYPAASPGVIAVGAVGPDDTVAPFSRRGKHIALCAPGVAIWSTLPTFPGEFGFESERPPGERRAMPRPLARNTRYDAWPGTSGACPHVTAAVALLLASRGPLRPAEVKRRLMRSADRVPGMRGRRFDPSYGAGRLNLRRLLEQSP